MHASVQQNIFSSSDVDPEQIKLSLEKAKITAGFEDPSFFKKNWQTQLKPLPAPRNFAKKLAYPASELVFSHVCQHAVGWGETFIYGFAYDKTSQSGYLQKI
jgi:hypothetical protein